MEKIINNPGHQNITENIFLNLDYEDLEACGLINKSCSRILDDPFFWLKKYPLSKKNQDDWTKAIQMSKNSDMEKNICLYLKWNLNEYGVEDLRCYTDPNFQKFFQKQIFNAAADCDDNTIRILAPLTDDPNAPNKLGRTPIHWAAHKGNIEIIKILAPLTDNPNAPNKDGETPMHHAAYNGHTEIVKFLAPLTDNPNAQDKHGYTPIYWATCKGHTEIVKILAPLSDNPNTANKDGDTPIFEAVCKGNIEIVHILAPLTENPNAPDNEGKTPIEIAKNAKIRRILESFETSS